MGEIKVSSQVYEAVRQAQARHAGTPDKAASAGEVKRIEDAILADGKVDGEETKLVEAMRSGTSFTISDGTHTTPIAPNSLSFPSSSSAAQLKVRAGSNTEAPAPVSRLSAPTPTTPVSPSPQQLIHDSKNTFDLATRQLEAGNGEAAAEILSKAAVTLRASSAQARPPQKGVLEELANNMDARASAYRKTTPDDALGAAGSLNLYGNNALKIAEGLKKSYPGYATLMEQVGRDSKIQAQIVAQTAANTKSMVGLGVSKMYRSIVLASFDKEIKNGSSIHNAIFHDVDKLKTDRQKMVQVFDYIDKKMQNEGLTFHEAWDHMFRNNTMFMPASVMPGFVSENDAATFLRDHKTSSGMLAPMAGMSQAIMQGNPAGIDKANADLIASLRQHDQWAIAGQVLKDFAANANSSEGKAEAARLQGNESGEYWKAKAFQFAREDLPVLLLTGAVTGGVGAGARTLAGLAGWGARAARTAQVASELVTFVPTERLLNEAINGRGADWSAKGLARDYALTVASFGMFRALGAAWTAMRGSNLIGPTLAEDASRLAGGRPTKVPPKESAENIRALTRENETAQTLSRAGYDVIQNPPIPGGGGKGVKMPDYSINGQLFDNVAPNTDLARGIWARVQQKVTANQARRIVLTLDDSKVTMDALRKQFADWPIEGLEQIIVVRGGKITNLPFVRPPSPGPWITPGAYPHQDRQ